MTRDEALDVLNTLVDGLDQGPVQLVPAQWRIAREALDTLTIITAVDAPKS